MPRHPEPHWRDEVGCYVFVHRRRKHYLRGIPKGDRTAAWERARAIMAGEEEEDRRARDPTVEDVCAAYLLAIAATHKRRTVEGHEAMLRRFCAFEHRGGRYGDRPAAEVLAVDLGRVDRAWKAAGHAPGYRAQLVKSVLACWAWAHRPDPDRPGTGRILAENHLAGYKRPSVRRRSDRLAERSDLAALLRWARKDLAREWAPGTKGRCLACTRAGKPGPCRRNHAASVRMLRDTLTLWRVIGETGARPGELCGARWEDWQPRAGKDQRGHWWGILAVEHKTIRFTGAKRKVVVPPALARAIERIRAREGRHPEFIWTHRRGKGGERRRKAATAGAGEPWNATALGRRLRQWRDEAVAAGAPVPPGLVAYALRHGYYSKVAPVLGAELAGLLGGTSGAVVRQVYLHGREADLIEGQARGRKRSGGG